MNKSKFITQKDNMSQIERQAYTFRQKLINNIHSIEEVGETFPIIVNTNGWRETTYLNQLGQRSTNLSNEEIRALGNNFWRNHFEEDRLIKGITCLLNNWQRLEAGLPVTFWNNIRAEGSKEYKLHSYTTVLLKFNKQKIFLGLSLPVNQLGVSNRKMSRLLEEEELVTKYYFQFQQLTPRELEIIKLIVYGNSNPDIAEKLFIARTTVETHRKNLNRKLGFSSYFQLVRLAQAFDLV